LKKLSISAAMTFRVAARRLAYSSSLSAAPANFATEAPSAAAIPRNVTQDGLPSPLSIWDSMLRLSPASLARSSWVAPFLLAQLPNRPAEGNLIFGILGSSRIHNQGLSGSRASRRESRRSLIAH
jgi:hypothetical protein